MTGRSIADARVKDVQEEPDHLEQLAVDRAQHGVGFAQHISVPKAHHAIAGFFERLRARIIVALSGRMLSAVELDHQFFLQGDEVDDVAPDRVCRRNLNERSRRFRNSRHSGNSASGEDFLSDLARSRNSGELPLICPSP